ncbi:hypothetical protein [uncultured Aquimarina sp.]|uniref:CIS tube protein n=1 Tax=uncultured Aquimarina sp. TaxID=575652 RepID=UPI00262B3376|nr:hypothetical protein [uncultured Aquimarina sp.]
MASFNNKKVRSFKLQKLKITSYDKKERKDSGKEFEVMFNPESVRRSFTNKYTKQPSNPQNEDTVKFTNSARSTVRMKLIFDGTNVHQYGAETAFRVLSGSQTNVTERIDGFLTNIVKIKGKIHEPPFLKLSWGQTLDFNCRLNDLDINYTMFARSGDPLRAELNVSFIEDDALDEQLAKLDLQSPDLTHYRIVKAGDQLPLMCQDIYGSPMYYPLVARVNKLKSFRNLTPGQEIYFPPIEK